MKNNFQRDELQAPLSEINMTPMVDIMLVLLVIFLITAPIINSAINVNLPKENAKIISEEKAITISINKEGRFFLEEAEMSLQDLSNHLQKIFLENPRQMIRLRADESVEYKAVSSVLATAQKIGLSNISFITQN